MSEIITLISCDGTEFVADIRALVDNYTFFQGVFNSTWTETLTNRISFTLFDKRIISSLVAYSLDKKADFINFSDIDFEEYLFFTTYFGSSSLLTRCIFHKIRELSFQRTGELQKLVKSGGSVSGYVFRVREIIDLVKKYNTSSFLSAINYERCMNLLDTERIMTIFILSNEKTINICDIFDKKLLEICNNI